MKPIITLLDTSSSKQLIDIQKNDGFVHAYYLTQERLEKLFANGELFFGAYLQGKLVGFASINIDVVRLRIHFFFVDQASQGMGVGNALLQHVIDMAGKEKVRNIYVYTEVDSPLEQFLLHKGFEKAGYFKRRFGDKDANILSLYLQ